MQSLTNVASAPGPATRFRWIASAAIILIYDIARSSISNAISRRQRSLASQSFRKGQHSGIRDRLRGHDADRRHLGGKLWRANCLGPGSHLLVRSHGDNQDYIPLLSYPRRKADVSPPHRRHRPIAARAQVCPGLRLFARGGAIGARDWSTYCFLLLTKNKMSDTSR